MSGPAERMAGLADELPQLTAAQRELPRSFEWWYFDLETEADQKLVLAIGKNPCVHRRRAGVYVKYTDPNCGEEYERNLLSRTGALDLRREERSLQLALDAHNQIRLTAAPDGAIDGYSLCCEVGQLTVQLKLQPLRRGFKLCDDGVFLCHRRDPGRFAAVVFAAPWLRGTGTISCHGRSVEVVGEGYHDHTWGTADLTRSAKQWHWGRLRIAGRWVVFADVQASPDYQGGLRFLSSSERVLADYRATYSDWRRDRLLSLKSPHALLIETPDGETFSGKSVQLLDDKLIYNRSLQRVKASIDGRDHVGGGWTEFFKMPPRPFRPILDLLLLLQFRRQRI